MLLKHLLAEKVPKTAIAKRLGCSRGLIYHWIRTGQLERDLSAPPPARTRVAPPGKLEPYKPLIAERLATYPELSAVRLFTECRAAGYTGGLTQLKVFVRAVRPQPEPEPVVRFETAPGHQAQVDFATVHFPWGKRHALLVVLGYSRLLWLQFYPRQTMATVIAGLEAAFAYFGGVPRELLFDQMRSVILADERDEGGKLLENPEFLRFAAHWNFRIRACRPYRAQTKGKVERPVRYVRGNFVYGREFLGDGDLDAQGRAWLDHVANARVHGTTCEVPWERFRRDELAALQALASRPYRSLVLAQEPVTAPADQHVIPSLVTVERRPLSSYSALVESYGTPDVAEVA